MTTKLTNAAFLKLVLTPENRPATVPGELLAHTRFIGDIKHLLVDPDYFYAEMTLRGIMGTVASTQYVTPGQRRAVENITAAPQRRGERGNMKRRRYEE